MMQTSNYKQIAYEWQPEAQASPLFYILLWGFIISFLTASITISSMHTAEPTRQEKAKIPERIVKFVAQQPKKIEPLKPKPISSPHQKLKTKTTADTNISRQHPQELRKPLTTNQKKARDAVSNSGLLALSNELADIADTSSIDQSVRRKINTTVSDTESIHHLQAIVGETPKPGTVINQDQVISPLDKTTINDRSTQGKTVATERAEQANQQIVLNDNEASRSGSDVGSVFNKNRSQLHSLYERERRKNTTLKGKIVFQLTIAPSGKVSNIKIVSSELQNPELEARLLARIRTFTFSSTSDIESVVINYPVEFIPS